MSVCGIKFRATEWACVLSFPFMWSAFWFILVSSFSGNRVVHQNLWNFNLQLRLLQCFLLNSLKFIKFIFLCISVRSRAQKKVASASRGVTALVLPRPASLTWCSRMRTNRSWRTPPHWSSTTSNGSPPSTKTTRTTSSASSSTLSPTCSSPAAVSSAILKNGQMRRLSLKTEEREEKGEREEREETGEREATGEREEREETGEREEREERGETGEREETG